MTDYAIQYNVKTPRDSLINIQGDTTDEFAAAAAWVTQHAAQFIDLETAIKGVPPALAANVTTTQVVHNNQQQGSYSNEPTGPAPTCKHGPMNFKSAFSKKKGKNYSGYFCPADDCPPSGFQWAS